MRNWKTRKQRDATLAKWARRDFAKHKATRIDCPPCTVIEWSEPGTCIYRINYVFYGGAIFVSGDLGEAVYQWYGKIMPEFVVGYSLDYFWGKCCTLDRSTSSDDFDPVIAMQDLRDILSEYRKENQGKRRKVYTFDEFLEENYLDGYEGGKEELHEQLHQSGFCWGKEKDGGRLTFADWYETHIGEVVPTRTYLHHVGLCMAVKQLTKQQEQGGAG